MKQICKWLFVKYFHESFNFLPSIYGTTYIWNEKGSSQGSLSVIHIVHILFQQDEVKTISKEVRILWRLCLLWRESPTG